MDDLNDERSDIDFDVAKSIRYHAYRRSFWEMLDSWAKILTVLSGTAVLVSFAQGNHAGVGNLRLLGCDHVCRGSRIWI